MIKFKHDTTPSLSIVAKDCRTFRRWEDGIISTETAMEQIMANNGLKELAVEEFIRTAVGLGYIREDLYD